MSFTVSVHCVDHKHAIEVTKELNTLGIEGVEFVTDSALDMCIRQMIDLPTYVATGGPSLSADMFLYIDVEVKPAIQRLKARGLKVIPNRVQLERLKYRQWADVGALQEKTFSLCPDKEHLREHEVKAILEMVINKKRELRYDYCEEENGCENTRP